MAHDIWKPPGSHFSKRPLAPLISCFTPSTATRHRKSRCLVIGLVAKRHLAEENTPRYKSSVLLIPILRCEWQPGRGEKKMEVLLRQFKVGAVRPGEAGRFRVGSTSVVTAADKVSAVHNPSDLLLCRYDDSSTLLVVSCDGTNTWN